MRAVFILLALSLVLAWLGYETWPKARAVSHVFFGFSAFFAFVLLGAFLDWY